MINTYYLTSKRLSGHIEVQYTNGVINAVKTVLKEPLNQQQFDAFTDKVPMNESDLPQLKLIGLHAAQQDKPNDKIALFCSLYEKYKKVKYIVSRADAGKIKLIKFDADMLDHYFTSDNFLFRDRHSISNLIKYYNELKAEIAAPKKGKYPNHFDKAYQDKLKQDELKLYWAHLRSMGLVPKKDRLGNTVDWVKAPVDSLS